MKFLKKSVYVALAGYLCIPVESAFALGDQWYIGFGGGASWLDPNPVEIGLGVQDEQGVSGNVFFGVDIDDRSSAQLTFYGLGEAELDNDEPVSFYAVDGSVLYRFYDTNDRRLVPSTFSLALYGRFALGFLERDTDAPLSDDAAAYFGAGGGAELFLTRNLSLRAEGMYHDRDAASGSLQLVARFGGRSRPTAGPNIPALEAPDTPALPQVPAAPSTDDVTVPPISSNPNAPITPVIPAPTAPAQNAIADADGDRIPNASDQCPASAKGFPVRANGCALFDGVLSGVNFSPRSSLLLPESTAQLDYLANVLTQYPEARIELHSHADDQGSVREQAILTRGRLRTIGTYLVGRGVKANRLTLRSFGGTRPLYDNSTNEGRAGNNRIEVLEKGNQ